MTDTKQMPFMGDYDFLKEGYQTHLSTGVEYPYNKLNTDEVERFQEDTIDAVMESCAAEKWLPFSQEALRSLEGGDILIAYEDCTLVGRWVYDCWVWPQFGSFETVPKRPLFVAKIKPPPSAIDESKDAGSASGEGEQG